MYTVSDIIIPTYSKRCCMEKTDNTSTKPKTRLIRLPEVLSRTGYGRTSIYRKMEKGEFPKNLKLGAPIKDPTQFDSRAIAWIEEEVDQWVESRIEERDSSYVN
jgi:prophage regulatory protein